PFLWNARSVVNKRQQLFSFIFSSDYHIVAITETWCCGDMKDREFLPNRYSVFRKDRDSRGGGVFTVLLAFSDSLATRQLNSPDTLKLLAVEVHAPKPIIVCLVYVPPPPSTSYLSLLFDYLASITVNRDLNCPSR
uniref:Tick transposon n=1 Tax=Amphimedon queenslandica TaxID=400682 RepID=A0A1X7SRD4_AMPQE